MTNQNQFELATNKISRKFGIIFSCFSILVFLIAFFNNAQILMYFAYVFIGISILSFIDALDKRPILIIDKEGVWIKSINKKIYWRHISSFNTVEIFDPEGAHMYKIYFHIKNEKVRFIYSFADKNIDEVRSAIINYSTNFNVIDNGHIIER
jgi:hypothetical protein